MANSNFILQGDENLMTIFRELPENGYRKPVISAFKKAAKPVAAAMGNSIPAGMKSIKKIIRIKPGRARSMFLTVGFTAGISKYINRRGQKWDPWQIIYWANYGTLANRAANHNFKMQRRKKTAHWQGGIKPGLFVEQAVEQSLPEAQRIFEKEFEVELQKFFEKHAAK